MLPTYWTGHQQQYTARQRRLSSPCCLAASGCNSCPAATKFPLGYKGCPAHAKSILPAPPLLWTSVYLFSHVDVPSVWLGDVGRGGGGGGDLLACGGSSTDIGYTKCRVVTQVAPWLHSLPTLDTPTAMWLRRLPLGYNGCPLLDATFACSRTGPCKVLRGLGVFAWPCGIAH
jgi:hypothetical protein